MRIGVVGFSSLGGSGVIAAEVAMGLAERGHEVHLFAPEPPHRIADAEGGLRFHAVSAPAYPSLSHPPYALALASRLIEVGKEAGLDLIHVHYAVPHAASALLAAHALGPAAPRVVVSLHGTDVTQVGTDPAYRASTTHAVQAAAALTVPSDYLRRRAEEAFGLAGRIEVIPNFVDTERFHPGAKDLASLRRFFPDMEEDAPLLVHVSNFRPVKRPVDLMDALARIREQLPARMLLVGDGPERVRTEAQARELGLCGAVRFLGARPDFHSILRQADLFLIASQDESFCLAALEALASGVPVVGYRVGGLPELVTGEVGALAKPFDPDALAEAALAILRSPRRHEMGERARERAENDYQRGPALDRYEALFSRLGGPSR